MSGPEPSPSENEASKGSSSTSGLWHKKCADMRAESESGCSICSKESAGTETERLIVLWALQATCVCIEAGNEAEGATGTTG